MKIGYLVPYDMICGESEARMRYTYLLEKLGHEVVPLDINGYTFDTKELRDDYDFVISHCVNEQLNIVLPDSFLLFFLWCPSVFFPRAWASKYLLYMNKHDAVVGGYDSKFSLFDIKNTGYFDVENLLPMYASVPKDFVIPPKRIEKRKFFHVGMGVRYESLIETLTKLDMIDIYGPDYAFGKKVWADYKAYKGRIKSDGKEIIKKMSEAGIVLALHSLSHNSYEYVSNRIFEGAASGSVMICDDNSFIKKYFGDSVFYIDTNKPEHEYEKDIINIVNYINENPDKAYDMTKRAQDIFVEKLALDNHIQKMLDYVEAEKKRLASIDYGMIDVIGFGDSEKIKQELAKQTYKNINFVPLICNDNETIGEAFYRIKDSLNGDYFMFMDDKSVMHKHHIFKLLDYINKNNKDFAYSGTYIRKDGYKTINVEPLDIKQVADEVRTSSWNADIFRLFDSKIFSNSVIFKNDILKLSNRNICYFDSLHLHLYFMVLSLLENRAGAYAYTLSSGKVTEETYDKFLYDHMNRKLESYIINLNKAFLKYLEPDIVYSYVDSKRKSDYRRMYKKAKKSLIMYIITHIFSYHNEKVQKKIKRKKQELKIIKEKSI